MPIFNSFVTATIYGTAQAFDAINGGWQVGALYRGPSYQAFPKNGVKFFTISPSFAVTNAIGVSVTLNSIIEILPTGLGITSGIPQPLRLLSDSTFTNLYNQGA